MLWLIARLLIDVRLATLVGAALAGDPELGPVSLPSFTHPIDPEERAKARARVAEVHAAIDQATSDPRLRWELRRICRRESACNWHEAVTVHAGDSSGGRRRWEMAVRAGLLTPETCAAHQLGDAASWSTYGPLGIAAAWTVPLVGECVGPEALNDPRVAVRAGVAWIDDLCRRRGACTCEARVRWWVGPLIWEKRSPWSRMASIERQCGDLPWSRWALAFFRS